MAKLWVELEMIALVCEFPFFFTQFTIMQWRQLKIIETAEKEIKEESLKLASL
jgi:hypothetical protein